MGYLEEEFWVFTAEFLVLHKQRWVELTCRGFGSSPNSKHLFEVEGMYWASTLKTRCEHYVHTTEALSPFKPHDSTLRSAMPAFRTSCLAAAAPERLKGHRRPNLAWPDWLISEMYWAKTACKYEDNTGRIQYCFYLFLLISSPHQLQQGKWETAYTETGTQGALISHYIHG